MTSVPFFSTRWLHATLLLAAWLLAGCNATAPLQSLSLPGGLSTSAAPTTSSGAAGVAGLLGAQAGLAGTRAGSGTDLIQMLSQSIDNIDEKQEIEIGRHLAAVLLGSKPMHPDLSLQRYVNQLGRWISLQSTRPNLPWTFIVLNDSGFNAFAAPGGYIFVTKGLVDRVRDEAELAGILAHEITHVTSRHHLRAIAKAAQTGVLTTLLASQVKNNLGNVVANQLLALGRNLYARGLDREDEFEADRRGVALAARAGLDPYGLLSVVQQLRGAAANDGAFALSLSTHPPAQQRLDRVGEAMGHRLDALSGQRAVSLNQRLGRAAAPARSAPRPATRASQPLSR